MDVSTAQAVRANSLVEVRSLAFPPPPAHLPLIEKSKLRPQREVIDRALVLNVVINCALQMPTDFARSWLRKAFLTSRRTRKEVLFLDGIDQGEDPSSRGFELQVEAQWVLAWALGFVEELNFADYCGGDLAGLFPDLRQKEDRCRVDQESTLLTYEEVYQALDVCYCLTWGIANANLTRTRVPGAVEQYVFWERRRALEWLLGGDWDDYPRDT